MNELIDNLLIKFLFALLICLLLFFYKIAHRIFYPSAKLQFSKQFNPTANFPDTIHLFSRILGIGIILSSLIIEIPTNTNVYLKIFLSISDIFFQSSLSFCLFLVSIYILESITLFNFDYNDEIQKRQNTCYAFVCFSQTIALAFIMKIVLSATKGQLVLMVCLWLFSMVLIGFATKIYKWISPLSFNKLMIQKDLTLAFSYSGFIIGIAIIIVSAFSQNIDSLQGYTVQVLLNIIKAVIVFPIFFKGIRLVFKVQELKYSSANPVPFHTYGYGVYEGILFLSTSILTSIVVNQITFGGMSGIY